MSHYQQFDIPPSWEWTTLGEIFSMKAGKNIQASDLQVYSDEAPFPCYGGNGIRGYLPKFSHQGTFPIIGRQGALCGNIKVASGSFYATEHAVVVEYFSGTSVELWRFFLENLNLNQYATATAQPGLSVAKIEEVPIPLPPINEQYRIVEKISEWLSTLDAISLDVNDLRCEIEDAKSKILELAMQGKLVAQDPSDEPAADMLKRINPKAKIITDNPHYQKLPENWAFTTLEDITQSQQPQPYIVKNTDYSAKYSTPVLTAGKSFILGYTNENDHIFDKIPVIIFDDFTTDSHYVDFPFKVKSSAMKIISVADGINIEYVAFYMSITRLTEDTHKRYWISEYSKLTIPIPPREEQDRIVFKIKETFQLLDSIETTLS